MSNSGVVASLCRQFVVGRSEHETSKTLSNKITLGETDLVDVVEALGVYLTSKDVDHRARGTKLLSALLQNLHTFDLSLDEVHYLATFYCDRLKDNPLVVPHVLEGLVALVSHRQVSDVDVAAVIRAVFKEVHNQSLPMASRRTVYSLLYTLLTGHLNAVKSFGSEFILGYIQAMDGEQDPRNLTIVFPTVLVIVNNLPIETLAEDLFEVVACYFPVDFTPPPDDVNGVSREELAEGLRRCLISSAKFSQFCLPLLLDKLSSELQVAKLESLKTLGVGAGTFGADMLSTFMEPVWNALRKEVFLPISDEVELASLKALTAVAAVLTTPLQEESSVHSDLNKFIGLVMRDCQRHLKQPGLRLMQPAAAILKAVASGSMQACYIIGDAVLPSLVEQLSIEDKPSVVRTVLGVVMEFVGVFKKFPCLEQTDHNVKASPLHKHKKALISWLFSALGNNDLNLKGDAVVAIATMLDVLGCLCQDEVQMCGVHLLEMALTETDKRAGHECMLCLGLMGRLYQSVVLESLLPSLLDHIRQKTNDLCSELLPKLQVVIALSSSKQVMMKVLPVLLTVLESALTNVSDEQTALMFALAASEGMRTITEVGISEEGMAEFVLGTVINGILRLCLSSLGTEKSNRLVAKQDVMDHLSAILRVCTQAMDVSLSKQWVDQLMDIFVRGSSPLLSSSNCRDFFPLQLDSPAHHASLLPLFAAAVGSLQPEVAEQVAEELLPRLLLCCCQSPHPATTSCVPVAKCYASIINKLPEGPFLQSTLEKDMADLWNGLHSPISEDMACQRALCLWLWITRALVLHSHPMGLAACKKLLTLLDRDCLGRRVSDQFCVVVNETEEVLSAKCHAKIRLFHGQRLFSELVPELVKLFHSSPPGVRGNCLKILSCLMQSVPKQVLLADLPSLLPLLMESLQSGDDDGPDLQLSTLEGLYSLAHDAPSVLGQDVQALLPRLLLIAQGSKYSNVRIAALECTGVLTILPHHLVYPYKSEVIRGLAPCLDDKKRLVRKAAVKSRSEWFFLGA